MGAIAEGAMSLMSATPGVLDWSDKEQDWCDDQRVAAWPELQCFFAHRPTKQSKTRDETNAHATTSNGNTDHLAWRAIFKSRQLQGDVVHVGFEPVSVVHF